MMLKDIRLYLDVADFDRVLCSKFLFSSCYVSNYLSRGIRGIRWNSESYKGILIKGVSRGDIPAYLSSQGNLIVPLEFEQEKYMRLNGASLHEFYLSLFCAGIEKAALCFEVPVPELLRLIDGFRSGGYKNQWIFKRRTLGKARLLCSLICDLDQEDFSLSLSVARKGVEIFRQKILQTKPDELIFSHKFKDLKLQDNKIVVLDEFENSIFELPMVGME